MKFPIKKLPIKSESKRKGNTGRPKPLVSILAAVVLAAMLLTLGLTRFTQVGFTAQDGFAVPQDELTRLLKDGETGNVTLKSVAAGEALYTRTLSDDYYIGDDKDAISGGYPLFARGGNVLYFLDDSLKMVTEDWTVLSSYDGLYLSDGTTFNADRSQADIDEVLLVQVQGGYQVASETVLGGAISDTTIPMNSVCAFSEDKVLFFDYEKGNLVGSSVDVQQNATITIGEHTYDYKDFLEKLGLWEKRADKVTPDKPEQETQEEERKPEETKKTEHVSAGAVQTPAAALPAKDAAQATETVQPADTTKPDKDKPEKDRTNQRDPAKQPEAPSDVFEEPEAPPAVQPSSGGGGGSHSTPDPNPGYREPKVSFGSTITPWVYTLTVDATVEDPGSVLRGGVEVTVYQVGADGKEKQVLRQAITSSGKLALGQLRPDCDYHITASYRYYDKLNYPKTVDLDVGTGHTLPFSEVGPIHLSFYDETSAPAGSAVDIFSTQLQLREMKFDNVATGTAVEVGGVQTHPAADTGKAETYVNALTLAAKKQDGDSTNTLSMPGEVLRLLREGYTLSHWETPEGALTSGTKYDYDVAMADRYGNQFTIDGVSNGTGHTCRLEPSVDIKVPQAKMQPDSTEINITWKNPDDAAVSKSTAENAPMGDTVAALYIVKEGDEVTPGNAIPLDGYPAGDKSRAVTGQKFLPVTVNSDGEVTEVEIGWTVTNLGIVQGYTAAVLCGSYDIEDGKTHVDETLKRETRFVTASLSSLGTISYTSKAENVTADTADVSFYMNEAEPRLLPLLDEVTLSLAAKRHDTQTLKLKRDDLEAIPVSYTALPGSQEQNFNVTVNIPVWLNDAEQAQTAVLTLNGTAWPQYNEHSAANVWEYLLATSQSQKDTAWLSLTLGSDLITGEGEPLATLLTLTSSTSYEGTWLTQASQGGTACDVTNRGGDKLLFSTSSQEALVHFSNCFVSSEFIELYGLGIEDAEDCIQTDDADRGGSNVLIRISTEYGAVVSTQYVNSAESYDSLRITGLEKDQTYVMTFSALKYREGDQLELDRKLMYAEGLYDENGDPHEYRFTTGQSVTGSLSLDSIGQLYETDDGSDVTTSVSLLSSSDFYRGVRMDGSSVYFYDPSYNSETGELSETGKANREAYLSAVDSMETTDETRALARAENTDGTATTSLRIAPHNNGDTANCWMSRFIAVNPGDRYAIYNAESGGYTRVIFYYRDKNTGALKYFSQYANDNIMLGGVFRVPSSETSTSIYADQICYMRLAGGSTRDCDSMVFVQYDNTLTENEPNLLDGISLTEGMQLTTYNSRNFRSGYAFTEDYIPVTGGSVYEIKGRDLIQSDEAAINGGAMSNSAVLFYDSSYAFLGGYNIRNQTALVKAPFGAAYCRFNIMTDPSADSLDTSGVSIKEYRAAITDRFRADMTASISDPNGRSSILEGGTYTVTLYTTNVSVSDSDDLTAQDYDRLGEPQTFTLSDDDFKTVTDSDGNEKTVLSIDKALSFSNLSPGRGFRATLEITPKGWKDSVLLDTTYFTTNRVTHVISDLAGLRAIRNDPAGSYIVTADIDMSRETSSTILSSDRPFTGVLDFQGHRLTVGALNGSMINRLSESGVIKNLIVDYNAVRENTTSTVSYTAAVALYNYGTIQNVIVNYSADDKDAPNDVRYSGGITYINYGTIDGFVVQFMKDIRAEMYFGGVAAENQGTISNGYICGAKVTGDNGVQRTARVIHRYTDANGAVAATNTAYVALGVGASAQRATVKNVFVLGDLAIESASAKSQYNNADWNGDYTYKADYENSTQHTELTALIIGNNNGAAENMFAVGDRLDFDAAGYTNYMINRGPAIGYMGGRYIADNVTYFSDAIYSEFSSSDGSIGTYNQRGDKQSLYDYTWYESPLGEDGSRFNIRANVDDGYYPQLILPSCFKSDAQPHIELPYTVGSRVEVVANEVRTQGTSEALATISLKFPYAGTAQVTGFTVVDRNNVPIDCKVLAQRSVDDNYRVDVLLSLPEGSSALPDSVYTITAVQWTGGAQDFTIKSGEHEIHADFWKTISSVPEWIDLLAGTGKTGNLYGNYLLTADLDFSARTDYHDWRMTQTFFGKLDGGIYETQQVELTDSAGNTILDAAGNPMTIETRGAVTGMHTISGVGNADTDGKWSQGRGKDQETCVLIYNLRGTMRNLVFTDFVNVLPGAGQTDNSVYSAYNAVIRVANAGALIENCHVRDSVFYGRNYVGGLVGATTGATIRNSSARRVKLYSYLRTGTTEEVRIGGLVGQATGSMVDSCFAADVTVEAQNAYATYGVGGLIGNINSTTVLSCYSTGSVNASGSYVGGIGGAMYGNSTVSECWSAATVQTVADFAGGVVGYHAGGVLVKNYTASTVITQSLASSSVHRICSSTDYDEASRHDNYAFKGQYITYTDYSLTEQGLSPYQFGTWDKTDGATSLLDDSKLSDPQVWRTVVGLGTSYTLSPVDSGLMPKLIDTDSGTMLYDQPDVVLGKVGQSVLSRINVGMPDTVNEEFDVTLGIYSDDDSIISGDFSEIADWDGMTVIGGEVDKAKLKDLSSYNDGRGFSLTIKYGAHTGGGHYLDSYILSLTLRHADGTTEQVQVRISLSEPVYREIYSISDWNTFFSDTRFAQSFENVRIKGDIDFSQGTDNKWNVRVNRLSGESGGTKYAIKNFSGNFDANSQNLIDQAVTEISDLSFQNITLITASNRGGNRKGVIGTLQGNISNVDFENIYIDGGTSSYLGCVGQLWGKADGVTLKDITVQGTGNQIGGFVGYANQSSTITNVTLTASDGKRNKITSTNKNGTQIGGIVGALEGIGSKLTVNNTDVSGRNAVGGAVGYTPGDAGRPSSQKLEDVTVGDPDKVSTTPGVLLDENGAQAPSVTVTCNADSTITAAHSAIGGVVGHASARPMSNLKAYNTLVMLDKDAQMPDTPDDGNYAYCVGGIAGNSTSGVANSTAKNITVASWGGWCGGVTGSDCGQNNVAEDCVVYGMSENSRYIGGVSAYSGGVYRLLAKHCVVIGGVDVGGLKGWKNSGSSEGGVIDSVILGRTNVGGTVGRDNGYEIYANYATATLDENGDAKITTDVTDAMIPGCESVKDAVGTYTGTVIRGDSNVGGLIGERRGVFTDMDYVSKGVTVKGKTNVGGLVGQYYGWDSTSSWSTTDFRMRRSACGASVEGESKVGGFVGEYTRTNNDPRNNTAQNFRSDSYGCLFTGSVTGDSGSSGFFVGSGTQEGDNVNTFAEPSYSRVYENATLNGTAASQTYSRYGAITKENNTDYIKTLTVTAEELADPNLYFQSCNTTYGGMSWGRENWTAEAVQTLYTNASNAANGTPSGEQANDRADFASYSNGIAQDNLVLWLDARNNTGSGYTDADSGTWVDLSNSRNNATLYWNGKTKGEPMTFAQRFNYMDWENGALEFYANDATSRAELEQSLSPYLQKGYTVEVVYSYVDPRYAGHGSVLSWRDGSVAGGFQAAPCNTSYNLTGIHYEVNAAGTGALYATLGNDKNSPGLYTSSYLRTASYIVGTENENGRIPNNVYINGTPGTEQSHKASEVAFHNENSTTWCIGSGTYTASMLRIYGVRVYNTVLTAAQIAKNAEYDNWYYFGGAKPSGAQVSNASVSWNSTADLIRSEDGSKNGTLVQKNYSGGIAGLPSRGYYYLRDANGSTSTVYLKTGPSYGPLLRTRNINNEYYDYTTLGQNVMRGQEGVDENGSLIDCEGRLYYGGYRLPDSGLVSRIRTVTAMLTAELDGLAVDGFPEVTAYASAADRVNLEMTTDAPEGMQYSISTADGEKLSGEWPSSSRTLTMNWDYKTPFTLTISLGEHKWTHEWYGTDISRSVMTYGSGYWYLYDDLCYSEDEQTVSDTPIVNMMNGRLLDENGSIIDAETGETIGAVTVPFTLTAPTPIWSGTAETEDGAVSVESYGTYLKTADGVISTQLVVKGAEAYTMPSSEVYIGGFVADSYNESHYDTILTAGQQMRDLLDSLVYPENFDNAGIVEISNTLGYNGSKVLVRYTSGALVAFDYLTGQTDEVLSRAQENTSFISFVMDALFGSDHSTWKNSSGDGLAAMEYQDELESDPELQRAWESVEIKGNGIADGSGVHEGKLDESAPGGVDGEAPGGTDTDSPNADGETSQTVTEGSGEVVQGDGTVVNGDGVQPGDTTVSGAAAAEGGDAEKDASQSGSHSSHDRTDKTDKANKSDKSKNDGTENENTASAETGSTAEGGSTVPGASSAMAAVLDGVRTRFVTVYDPETGEPEVYDLSELLTTPKAALVSENQKAKEIEKQGFKTALAGSTSRQDTRGETSGLLLVLVTAGVTVVLLVCMGVLKKRKFEPTDRRKK